MKYVLSIAIVLVLAGVTAAQDAPKATKFAEYEQNGRGCEEFFRVYDLLSAIKNQPGSKGLIVIYAGDKKERFGNVTAYAQGTKLYLEKNLGSVNEIDIVVAEGRGFFNKEYWIVPKEAAQPKFQPASFNWSELTGKYFFSTSCLSCEPSYPDMTSFQPNFEEFAAVLKSYPTYKGLITVGQRREIKDVTRILTTEQKLPRARYRVILGKDPLDLSLYVLPATPRLIRSSAASIRLSSR
jgi:hypothetical protein